MRRRSAVRKRGKKKKGLARRPPIRASTSRGRASGERDRRPGECELRLCAGRGGACPGSAGAACLVRPAAAEPCVPRADPGSLTSPAPV